MYVYVVFTTVASILCSCACTMHLGTSYLGNFDGCATPSVRTRTFDFRTTAAHFRESEYFFPNLLFNNCLTTANL